MQVNSVESAPLVVFLPGLGAVSTTFIAGVIANTKLGIPIVGSITQNHRLLKNEKVQNISELIHTRALRDLRFVAWDITNENAHNTALKAGVLSPHDIHPLQEELKQIRPLPGVFEKEYVPGLDASFVRSETSKRKQAEALRKDIRDSLRAHNAKEGVMVWCGSTERYLATEPVHRSLVNFEKGLDEDNPYIAPSMIYAYAAIKEGVPFANGAPNLTIDIPALEELAELNRVPIAGKDFKTGQTFMKTLVAPGLKSRLLGVNGWFSTNILGNKDGLVLNEPENFKTKESSKLESLNRIFEPEINPDLYGELYHTVRINYYPPRGDQKEGWDNIDLFGWMGYPMQIKINFLCRDSILAAPIVLDLALLLNWSQRRGEYGAQDWLSFYFKHPQKTTRRPIAIHDLMEQHRILLEHLIPKEF